MHPVGIRTPQTCEFLPAFCSAGRSAAFTSTEALVHAMDIPPLKEALLPAREQRIPGHRPLQECLLQFFTCFPSAFNGILHDHDR